VGSVSDEPNQALHPTRRLEGFSRLTALPCRLGTFPAGRVSLGRSAAEGFRGVEATPNGVVAAMLGLAEAQDLRRRAEAACRQWLRTADEEGDLGGLSPGDIQVVFERCALVFDHGVLSYPFVETRLGMYVADPSGVYFRGLRPVGHYRLITLLDGTADDDYFVLDEPRRAETGAAPDPAG